MYKVGDRVSYPMHGAGIIEAIEEREILGETRRYYVLRFALGGMKVMVPVDNIGDMGLREIIAPAEFDRVLQFLKDHDSIESDNWNRRYRENLDKIKTGNIYEIAEVVRNLIMRDRDKGLSTGERKMLGNARQILLSELLLVSGKDETEVQRLIDEAI